MRSYIVIFSILAIIIASLIALNIFFQNTLRMEMAEQFNKQQLLLAKAEATNIQEYIERVERETLRISKFLSTFPANGEKRFDIFEEGVLKELGNIPMGVRFLDRSGKLLYTNGIHTIEKPSARDIVELAAKFCPNDTSIRQEPQMVFVTTPVCRSGSFLGALFISIEIKEISKAFLSPIKSGSRGYAWMMDGKGDLLYHPTQPDMVGRNLYKTDTSCFKCHLSFDVEKKILEGKGDYFGKYVAPSGEDKVLAFSTASVGDSRWIVAVSAPYSEVTMPIHSSMKLYSWIVLLIFAMASVVSAMLIVLNRKRVKAEALAKHQKELEEHAESLERKVVERTRELSSEKDKLNTIVSTIGSGIILLDNKRKIRWTNERMKEIAGKDIIGLSCDDIFTDCTVLSSYVGDEVQTDVISNFFGNQERFFQVATAPVAGTEDGAQGYIRLIQDVTGLKRMEEQMMHSEKLALLGRLTSAMDKEVSNPMTSIFSIIDILREMEKDEFKKESLDTVSLQMHQIADILKQISGFSKTPSVELKSWKLSSLLENALSLIQYDARVNDITIVRDLQDHNPEITTDANQLSQVIIDLVLNAADAMPNGGTLTIRSRVKGNRISIIFEDTGVGIPRENLGRIFEPFYTTKEKGTGLGLSVSQTIVGKLRGEITAESEPGKGSTFIITLPLNGNPT